ncbi:hypothetical protein LTR09_006488 [Extremus antarcticus]|uniref:Heterokaryon incompatibility domain-containing protein n=1 Tax=Extremus antarcticus TaxID=702011 RepID=A0AAJ0DEE7_9PEZI|nr:hypothetical protein LTR09_006488 [Extremus antarcticus]
MATAFDQGCPLCIEDLARERHAASYTDYVEESYQEDSDTNADAFDPESQAAQIYRPIGALQLRLLELQPGKAGDPSSGQLHVANLDQSTKISLSNDSHAVDYAALSYCWGDQVFERSIQCNGVWYPITKNLYNALQHLRYNTKTMLLWVDALCINQTDLAERARHIHNMLAIFSRARTVIAWLGDSANDTQTAVRFAAMCNFKHPSPQPGMFNLCEQHQRLSLTGTTDLLSRAWFHRLWVKQEVWAARELVFCSGHFRVSWSELKRTAERLQQLQSPLFPVKYDLLHAYRNPFIGLRRGAEPGSGLGGPHTLEDLAVVLHRTAGSGCHDPRDHVYGVVGMAQVTTIDMSITSDGRFMDAEQSRATADQWLPTSKDEPTLKGWSTVSSEAGPFLIVDYSRSTSRVFQDVVRYIMRMDGNLNIFARLWSGSAENGWGIAFGGNAGGEPLPSWCPNLSSPLQNRDFPQYPRLREKPPTCQIPVETPDVLHLRGIIIGHAKLSYEYRNFVAYEWLGEQIAHHSHRVLALKHSELNIRSPGPDYWPERENWEMATWSRFNEPSWTALGWDDVVVSVEGSRALFVLRPQGRGSGRFTLVGLTYLQVDLTEDRGKFKTSVAHIALQYMLQEAREANRLAEFLVV